MCSVYSRKEFREYAVGIRESPQPWGKRKGETK